MRTTDAADPVKRAGVASGIRLPIESPDVDSCEYDAARLRDAIGGHRYIAFPARQVGKTALVRRALLAARRPGRIAAQLAASINLSSSSK